jgi:cyclin-dependent kinase-like
MNKYEIQGIVGEGAYGIVYRAKNKETGDIGKKHCFPWFCDNNSFFTDYSCYQKIQGVRRRWSGQKNNFQRSQNAENAQTRKYCAVDRSIQKVNNKYEFPLLNQLLCVSRKNRLYLVFEYLEKNLLEILEEKPNGLDQEAVRKYIY